MNEKISKNYKNQQKIKRKIRRYLRQVNIEGLLVPGQPPITWLLERGDTPLLKWVGTIRPNPMVLRKKSVVFLIHTSGFEGISIMCTSRAAK
jgi:hypothetical protein